jgi:carbon storage regulator
MLVLTRRPGEQIVIDGNIRLTVVSVKGDRVRIGIEAPPNVRVDREEIHTRRQHSPTQVPRPCLAMETAYLDRGVSVSS